MGTISTHIGIKEVYELLAICEVLSNLGRFRGLGGVAGQPFPTNDVYIQQMIKIFNHLKIPASSIARARQYPACVGCQYT